MLSILKIDFFTKKLSVVIHLLLFNLMSKYTIPFDEFKELADVFGGVLAGYLDSWMAEHKVDITAILDSELDSHVISIDEIDSEMLIALISYIKRARSLPEDKKEEITERLAKYSSSPVLRIGTKFDKADFYVACSKGLLEYAKWLGYPPDTMAFNLAIEYNQLSVVQWIYSIKPDLPVCVVDSIYANDAVEIYKILDIDKKEVNINFMCAHDAIKLFSYVYQEYEFDVHEKHDMYFSTACKHDSLQIVRLLYADGKGLDGHPVDLINTYSDRTCDNPILRCSALEIAYRKNSHRVVEFLLDLPIKWPMQSVKKAYNLLKSRYLQR